MSAMVAAAQIQRIDVDASTQLYFSKTSEDFGSPHIIRAQIEGLSVRRNDSSEVFDERKVLHSSSGRRYELDAVLKTSIYGEVIRAIVIEVDRHYGEPYYRRTHEIVAIKVYKRDKLRSLQGHTQENPLLEIPIMQFVGGSHPNLMGPIECCRAEDNLYMVMRYMPGGELFDYIADNGPLTESRGRDMFRQLLTGLSRLQSIGVAHRDMSLENILYDGENGYVIIDFGMALRLRLHGQDARFRGQSYNHSMLPTAQDMSSMQPPSSSSAAAAAAVRSYWPIYCALEGKPVCGKRNYVAPEVLTRERVFHPMLADMWALGIILCIALTGMPPTDLAEPSDARYCLIAEGQLVMMLESWGVQLSPEAMDLLNQMLAPDPLKRPLLEDLWAHPWMQMKSDDPME